MDKAAIQIFIVPPVFRVLNEPDAGAAVVAGPAVERIGLGALHVGLEAAEPEQPQRSAVPQPQKRSKNKRSTWCRPPIAGSIEFHRVAWNTRRKAADNARDPRRHSTEIKPENPTRLRLRAVLRA